MSELIRPSINDMEDYMNEPRTDSDSPEQLLKQHQGQPVVSVMGKRLNHGTEATKFPPDQRPNQTPPRPVPAKAS